MAEKKNNNYIVTIVLLLIGYYILNRLYILGSQRPPTNISTGSEPNAPIDTGVVSVNNPINTGTPELTGVTTNPVEITDVTIDQTTGIRTQCYTGCPNSMMQIVNTTNGDCGND